MSVTIVTGNATFPTSNLSSMPPLDPALSPYPAVNLPIEPVKAALVAIVAGIISFTTIVGNIMVMVSFKIDKQLQTISNYFLFSLAIADLIIGIISIPPFTVSQIMKKWPFSPLLCDAWLAIDYLSSNASVMNLLVISFDRYFSVTRPLSYRARRTTKKAALMITSAWGLSLVVWVPAIYAWPYIEGVRNLKDEQCEVQFVETNSIMSILCAMMAFFVPVTIMGGLYMRVWWETVKRQRDLVHLQAGKKASSKRSNSSTEEEAYLTSQPLARSEDYRFHLAGRCLHLARQLCSAGQAQPSYREDASSDCYSIAPHSSDTPLHPARSFNVLCDRNLDGLPPGPASRWSNAYQHNSHSTSDLFEELKGCKVDSVYTILIQFPASSLPDTAADTTSITMLSDTETNQDTPRTQSRSNPKSISAVSRSSSGSSVLAGVPPAKYRSFSIVPDSISLNTRIVPKSYVRSVQQNPNTPANSLPRKNKLKKATQEKRQERKAAKTLSAILLVFLLTWTPYNVLAVMKGVLGPEESDKIIPQMLWDISYCLCYINSTINPFCYALCNAAFRRTYTRILTCKWRSSQKQPVNTYYYG